MKQKTKQDEKKDGTNLAHDLKSLGLLVFSASACISS